MMKTKILTFLVLLILQLCIASIHGTMASHSRSASKASVTVNSGRFWAIAVDNFGNVYVTGYAFFPNYGSDYLTIKYDGITGEQLWIARYNGLGNGLDGANAIYVDESGYIYVTGGSQKGRHSGYATVKYDPDGVVQWVARYDGCGTSGYCAIDIIVDSLGNVYVTGSSPINSDYITVMYDSEGHEQWVARYSGEANGEDTASALGLDAAGNVYVTGSSARSNLGFDNDYVTIKYNSIGEQEWLARYNGPGGGDDEAQDLAVDNEGNAYVTGWSDSTTMETYMTTLKYSPDGQLQWERRYIGTRGHIARASAIETNGSDNIYVAGASLQSLTGWDYTTIKYNSEGAQQWLTLHDEGGAAEQAYHMTVDATGNVYVTGYSEGHSTSGDFVVVKYSSAGKEEWAVKYNGQGDTNDNPTDIAVDQSGNIYVAGNSTVFKEVREDEFELISNDYIIIKYDTYGFKQWLAQYSVEDAPEIQVSPILWQNYPNPFNATTVISYSLPAFGHATLKVFDVLGREVATLIDRELQAGENSVTFNATALPNGVYFYRLQAGAFAQTKKFLLLK